MTTAMRQPHSLIVKGTHDPRAMKVYASTHNGHLHGDFQTKVNPFSDGVARQCWDIEFPSVIAAALWADQFSRYFYFIDFRDGTHPESLMTRVVLTAECFNEGE